MLPSRILLRCVAYCCVALRCVVSCCVEPFSSAPLPTLARSDPKRVSVVVMDATLVLGVVAWCKGAAKGANARDAAGGACSSLHPQGKIYWCRLRYVLEGDLF